MLAADWRPSVNGRFVCCVLPLPCTPKVLRLASLLAAAQVGEAPCPSWGVPVHCCTWIRRGTCLHDLLGYKRVPQRAPTSASSLVITCGRDGARQVPQAAPDGTLLATAPVL